MRGAVTCDRLVDGDGDSITCSSIHRSAYMRARECERNCGLEGFAQFLGDRGFAQLMALRVPSMFFLPSELGVILESSWDVCLGLLCSLVAERRRDERSKKYD